MELELESESEWRKWARCEDALEMAAQSERCSSGRINLSVIHHTRVAVVEHSEAPREFCGRFLASLASAKVAKLGGF